MPLLDAKCTNCGGILKVDAAKDAAICPFCGSAFIVEKAINNYITTVNNDFTGANVNVVSELDQLISAAEGFQHLGEYANAFTTYKKVIEKYPQDVRGWIGCIGTYKEGEFFAEMPREWETKFLEEEPFSRWYKNAFALADEDTKNKLESSRLNYISCINRKVARFKGRSCFEDLKNVIGKNVYGSRSAFYVREKALYLISYYRNDGEDMYDILEVLSLDKNGDMHLKNGRPDKNDERVLHLDYYDELMLVLNGKTYLKNVDINYIKSVNTLHDEWKQCCQRIEWKLQNRCKYCGGEFEGGFFISRRCSLCKRPKY